MNLEIKQNHERKIYILILLSKSQKMLENKWVYTVKTNKNDNISKFKVRWVIQNFQQWKSIKYQQIYVLIIVKSTIQIIFTVTVIQNWHIKQINFITVFLNEILSDMKTVYMKQLIDYKDKTESDLICQLNQDLYDLKQFMKIWFDILIKVLKQLNFVCSKWNADFWMHFKKKIYLILYVDNVKLIDLNKEVLDKIIQQLDEHFNIMKLNHACHYLKMKVEYDWDKQQIHLSQKTYICYRNDSILLLNQKVNSSIVNQTRIIHYKSTHLSRILKYCKNDQILESHYQ